MIETAIFTKLSDLNNSLSLGLENDDDTVRIFPEYVRMDDKHKTTPTQLVFTTDDYKPDVGLDGLTPTTAQITVKIEAASMDADETSALRRQLVMALDSTRGTWGDTVIQGCFLEDYSDGHFIDTDMATILYYTSDMTFTVAYEIPTEE